MYIIFRPLITDEASIVAAECIFNEVDGEEVEMRRFDVEEVDVVDAELVECLIVPDEEGA